MPKHRIPLQSAPQQNNSISRPMLRVSDEGITFSFEALEKTEYFNLDCTCQNWSSDLLDMLKNISGKQKIELLNGTYRTYRVHTHENANPPNTLPAGVELKDCYQLRISTSKGGVHGIFSGNIFYIIWLDPLHNMYPDDRYGGLRVIRAPNNCCMERDEELDRLRAEIKKLEAENQFWESQLSKLD